MPRMGALIPQATATNNPLIQFRKQRGTVTYNFLTQSKTRIFDELVVTTLTIHKLEGLQHFISVFATKNQNNQLRHDLSFVFG